MRTPTPSFSKYPRPWSKGSVLRSNATSGNNTPPQLDRLVTRAQACATLSVHRQTLRRWTKSGKLTAYMLGRSVGYLGEDVRRLLKAAQHSCRKKSGPKSKPQPQAAAQTTHTSLQTQTDADQ